MPIKKLTFKIQGVSPILLHNGQTADPLNEWSKNIHAITRRRNKTDADHEEMARLEWYAGLYVFDQRVSITASMLHGTLIGGAKKEKKGPIIKAGIWFTQDFFPLIYDGPSNINDLWEDEKYRLTVGVRVQTSRIMRTRPKFDKWSLEFSCDTDNAQVDEADVKTILETAGRSVGLGDWRLRYGRFIVL